MDGTDPQANRSGKRGSRMLLAWLGAGGFIAMLVTLVYLTNLLDTLEDRLAYQPPLVEEAASSAHAIELADAQMVYVPVYSHIYSRGGEPFLLETIVSIRNSDPEHAISVTSARYYDTDGQLIEDYVSGVVTLDPLQSTEILVKKRDTRGGSGANFIVAWNAVQPVFEPVIEAVMTGYSKNQSISFKSTGRPLVRETGLVRSGETRVGH